MSEHKKRSEAAIAASNHWANKRVKTLEDQKASESIPLLPVNPDAGTDKQNPILIEDIKSTVDHRVPETCRSSPIRLLYNPSYNDSESVAANKDTLMIEELIGSKDLKETFQFNFSIDLPFFLTYLHPDFSKEKKKITFISGSKVLLPELPDAEFVREHFNVHEVIANVPNKFGTHHTKMMINFFEDDTVEIVIMTANLTKLDFVGLTQMCWRSGRLKKDSDPSEENTKFKRDLCAYIKRYGDDALDNLSEIVNKYVFCGIDVELVASTPGSYDISDLKDDDEIYGYGKLYQILRRNGLLLDNQESKLHYNVLAQISSISYPFATKGKDTASIFSHLICPLIFSGNQPGPSFLAPGSRSFQRHQKLNNYYPHIVFPSVPDVAENNVGFGAGQAVHFNYFSSQTHRNQYEQNIKPYLRRWNSSRNLSITGREKVVPHVKLYMCDNADNWGSLKWVMMCSHNLSKQAWGSHKGSKFTTTDARKYEVASYELGVLVPERTVKLIPCYSSDHTTTADRIPIRLPFKLPPVPYLSSDKPWSPLQDFGHIKDRYGQEYHGINS
ncbi:uncharacterized protein PRCAT00005654001 [Priceomyces carsonii]|uniref:uncharacterized protein n=1 Tax=Priceomyces carsonii TaxID=28549 RepID=UPI002EDAA6C3|nr:unnamed protein product [Priceomyces carsonii]